MIARGLQQAEQCPHPDICQCDLIWKQVSADVLELRVSELR